MSFIHASDTPPIIDGLLHGEHFLPRPHQFAFACRPIGKRHQRKERTLAESFYELTYETIQATAGQTAEPYQLGSTACWRILFLVKAMIPIVPQNAYPSATVVIVSVIIMCIIFMLILKKYDAFIANDAQHLNSAANLLHIFI